MALTMSTLRLALVLWLYSRSGSADDAANGADGGKHHDVKQLIRRPSVAVETDAQLETGSGGQPSPVSEAVAGTDDTKDCRWDDWAEWSACSATCGSGLKSRSRGRRGPFGDGKDCIGVNRENVNCNENLCPRDCVLGTWTDWSSCSVTCGGPRHPGQMFRTRSPKTKAAYGGKECEEAVSDLRPCMDHQTDSCPSDCVWGEWSAFSECTLSCGTYGGIKTRERVIAKQAQQGGRECTGDPFDTMVCNRKVCVGDCEWYEWQDWNECTVTCGKGIKLRVRDMSKEASETGDCPGSATDKAECEMEECSRDCKYMEWGEWTSCSALCGGGERTKKRSRIPETEGGKPCTEETEWSEPCNMDECTS